MRYLFIDRHHIQRIDGVQQVYHQPVKHRGPVLTSTRPWEARRLGLWSSPVWCEQTQRWRMWYTAGKAMLPLYAESTDGIHWDKPALDKVRYENSTQNNLVDLGFDVRIPKENRAVLLHDARSVDPQQRYKALTLMKGELGALASADGLTWRPLDARRIPTDDEYRLGYDALNGHFVATVKLGGWQGPVWGAVPELGRAVCLAHSDDFIHWSEPELNFWADEVDQEIGRQAIEAAIRDPERRGPAVVAHDQFVTDIYNMPLFTYEDQYLALPVLFHQSGAYFLPNGFSNQDGLLYPTLVSSRDLRHWNRLSRAPFIDLSPLSDSRCFDYGSIHPTAPVVHGQELWFYYSGSPLTHVRPEVVRRAGLHRRGDERGSAIFLARLRRDGFASMYGGPDGSVVLTTPVTVSGRRLHVNADAAGGELRAEVRDAQTGRALAGYCLGDYVRSRFVYSEDGKQHRPRMGTGCRFPEDPMDNDTVPMTDNATDAVVRWRERDGLEDLQGRKVRLYFHLRRAHLYSFWFGD